MSAAESFPPIVYDLTGVLILLFYIWQGYRRGLVREACNLTALIGATFMATPTGSLIEEYLPLHGVPLLLQGLAMMTLGFVAAFIVIHLVLFAITKALGWRKKWEGRTQKIIRFGGVLLGGTFGAVIILILGWYILSVGHLSEMMLQGFDEEKLQANESLLMPAKMLSTHRTGFSGSVLGGIAARTNPLPMEVVETIENIAEITSSPEKLQQIVESEEFQELSETDAMQNIIENEEIKDLARENDVMGLLNHPDVQALLEDPEVLKALESMDPEELMKMMEEHTEPTPAADDQ